MDYTNGVDSGLYPETVNIFTGLRGCCENCQYEVTTDLTNVISEVERAIRKYPNWPSDPLHALAVLGEEFGELTQAMLRMVYEPHKTSKKDIATKAIQTAAMAIRLFMSLGEYSYAPSEQHQHRLE